MVQFYYINDSVNQFAIVYMINPSPHFNNLFRKQFERCLIAELYEQTMKNMKYCPKKKNTCIMALIIFYDNNGVKPKKV